MRVIIWPSRGYAPEWYKKRPGGYKAGELVEWLGTEYVCVHTHHNPIRSPERSSLWSEVAR